MDDDTVEFDPAGPRESFTAATIHYLFAEPHIDSTCAPCKGGAAHRTDHYALGRLRLSIGAELGYNSEATQQLDMKTLLQRRLEYLRAGGKIGG